MAIKLNAKAAGKLREWADVVGFAELDIAVVDGKTKHDRAKGLFTGRHVLRTQPSAGYSAKTRYNLPASIHLEWHSFARAVKAGSPATVEELQATLTAKLTELGSEEIERGCSVFLTENGNTFASLTDAIRTVNEYLESAKTEQKEAEK